ncbi:MAG: peptidoglycan DD-metalloendopeptidase family protein [Candidatus Uhrbacteria bacterium]|nr:peptidoglycan DD-metalloendopeptidase family protein [Candidatus Uhrbacteria bacterium]
MKKNFIDSLKTVFLHATAYLLKGIKFALEKSSVTAEPISRIMFTLYNAALHPLILIGYSWYMKGALSLQRRGITVRHPLLSLVSRGHFHHTLLVGIFLLVLGHTVYLKNVNAQEFFIPHNAISRLFFADDEFTITTEGAQQKSDQEYIDQIGIRTQPTLKDIGSQQEASPTPDSGTIAAIPDALIKPALPIIQKEPYKATAIQTYSVQAGDTLGGIARAFGIKIATLLESNNLTEKSLIHEGQKLVVLPINGIQYRVRRGDTLAQIAQDYQSTISKIMEANHRESANDIAIGELLIIPDAVVRRVQIPQQPKQQNLIARIRNAIVPQSSSSRAARGLFIWPTSASRVTQYFSWRHTGVDIAGPTTNRIFAAGDGKVIFSGWANGYGYSIVVDHGGGVKTRYGHSRLLYVKSGDYVSQGQTIAMVGSTGRSTGPHLHFEVMKNGIRVNPFGYIK